MFTKILHKSDPKLRSVRPRSRVGYERTTLPRIEPEGLRTLHRLHHQTFDKKKKFESLRIPFRPKIQATEVDGVYCLRPTKYIT